MSSRNTVTLYRWQSDCLQEWERNHYRGIVQAVTGAGKTTLAISAIQRLRDRFDHLKVRVVVPTIPLAQQWKQALLRAASSPAERPGFFGGGQRDSADRDILVYVINSARDSLSRHLRADLALGYRVLVIYDECHHYQSKENQRIFEFLQRDDGFVSAGETSTTATAAYFSLGLSATPFGTGDDAVLLQGIGPLIYRYDLSAAVRDGVISPFSACQVAVSFTSEELEAYNDLSFRLSLLLPRLLERYPELKALDTSDFLRTLTRLSRKEESPSGLATAYLSLLYQRKEISVLASDRNRCCLDLLSRLSGDDKIIIFCERISQADALTLQIRRTCGPVCSVYHSKLTTEARSRILRSFHNGEIRILVTCRALDEGIDVPDANIGIVLSGSAVRRQRIQRLGRVIRRAEGKDAACLYYFYIRQSLDDSAFLRGLENCPTFDLRYDQKEHQFSHDLYEYAARQLLAEAGRRHASPASLRELRLCCDEGLEKADFLLEPDLQERNRAGVSTQHLRNYWTVMKSLGTIMRGEQTYEL